MLVSDHQYVTWLKDIKSNIQRSQIKASVAVNTELIKMYLYLGKEISEKQADSVWGSGFIDQLSKDLKAEFPEMSGFSKTNLFAIKKFYAFYKNCFELLPQVGGNVFQIIPQAGGNFNERFLKCFLIPWKHNILIIEKIKDINISLFYVEQTLENNWSRAVLEYQIETKLHERQGNIVSNFRNTLPEIQGDLAQQLFKDPYHFEFLSLSEHSKESDLERQLIKNITYFLLELGKGFAYMGNQFKLYAGDKEYRTDLLFYHTKLRCYIIIELKIGDFKPEYVGKLNFYLNVIDDTVKMEDDNLTIGIILCKSKDNIEVEYSIKNIQKPIGVGQYIHTRELPDYLRSNIPSQKEWNVFLDKNI
jgi:predicted nuclease of restriction endonuclease-like (RecB) superfamily